MSRLSFISVTNPVDVFRSQHTSLSSCQRRQRCRIPVSTSRMSIAPGLIRFDGAGDFEIRQYVGSLGFKTIVDWEYYSKDVNPLAPTRTVDTQAPQIRLYDARCIVRNPRLFNARVLLKEFLPDGLELAVNEAEAYKVLYESKANDIDPDSVPVATLLGSFIADESFDRISFAQQWAKRFPNTPDPPKPGSPFLVFRWEGNLTAGQFPAAVARGSSPGGRFFDSLWPSTAHKRTESYVVTLIYRALDALRFVHAAGLVHRSVGMTSLLVNTVEDRLASTLQVKLRDFCFSKPVSALAVGDELARARKRGAITPTEIANLLFAEDIYSLGYTFCELVFSSLVMRVPYTTLPDASQDRFKTTFEDTFELNVDGFREYCVAEEAWGPAVEFLDQADRAGWILLRDMLSAKKNFASTTTSELLKSHIFSKRVSR